MKGNVLLVISETVVPLEDLEIPVTFCLAHNGADGGGDLTAGTHPAIGKKKNTD